MKTDPVCGMDVSETSEYYTEYTGKTYYFCSESCRGKFLASANQYLQEDTGVKTKSGCGCGEKKAVSPGPETEPHDCCGGNHHEHQASSSKQQAHQARQRTIR